MVLVAHSLSIKGLALNGLQFIQYYSSSNLLVLDDYNLITASYINELVSNQGVSITESELDKLKDVPGVKFDLPLNDQTLKLFETLVGKPMSRLYRAGWSLYIYTQT